MESLYCVALFEITLTERYDVMHKQDVVLRKRKICEWFCWCDGYLDSC